MTGYGWFRYKQRLAREARLTTFPHRSAARIEACGL